MVLGFRLCGCSIADWPEKPAMIEPVHPLERGELHRLKPAPGPASANDLGLVEPDHGLGKHIVVGVPDAADGGFDARLGQSIAVRVKPPEEIG